MKVESADNKLSIECLFTTIGRKTELQEVKRCRISDLLRASVSTQKIMEVTNVSRAMVFKVKKRLSEGDDLKSPEDLLSTRS